MKDDKGSTVGIFLIFMTALNVGQMGIDIGKTGALMPNWALMTLTLVISTMVILMTNRRTINSAIALNAVFTAIISGLWLYTRFTTEYTWTEVIGRKIDGAVFGAIFGVSLFVAVVIADRKGETFPYMFVTWAKKAFCDDQEKSPTPRQS